MKTTPFLLATLVTATLATAQVIDNTPTRVQTPLDPGLVRIGTLQPKSVHEISTSKWLLGCETIDREYSDYHAWKTYLPALGIRCIRLQGGWARTEKDKGIYDFAWLDSIIDDALSRGLTIWLQTSYGNPTYAGGGGRTLAGGMPNSEEGLAAWDKWVDLMAKRYKGKVQEWEVWNEPELHGANNVEAIVDFSIRTAEIIKREIPDARITGLSLCYPKAAIVEAFVKALKERNKEHLFTKIAYHAYTKNPDTVYPDVVKIKEIVQKYTPSIGLRQGESGVESEYCVSGALSKYPWTEITQAKWNARRMLGDLGHGADSSVFTAADLDYRTTSFHNGLVRYGLLKTAGATENFRVLKVKNAYYTVQNVVSVFNDSVTLNEQAAITATSSVPLAAFCYQDKATKTPLCVFWNKGVVPSNTFQTVSATIAFPGAPLEEPVWVDVLSGAVFAIPKEKVTFSNNEIRFENIPAYDSPVFITDKKILKLQPWLQ